MSAADYYQMARELGFPGILLVMIFLGGWRIIGWSATWLSKKIDEWMNPIVKEHLGLIEKSSTSLEKIMEAIVRMEKNTLEHSRLFEEYAKAGRDYMKEGRSWRDSQRGRFLKREDLDEEK